MDTLTLRHCRPFTGGHADTEANIAAHSPTRTPHAVLRDYLQELPEPLVPFAAYTSVMDAALQGKPANQAPASEHTTECVSQHAQRRMRQALQSMAHQPAHMVTLRRLLRFLHRHIFLLPIRCAQGGQVSQVSQGTSLSAASLSILTTIFYNLTQGHVVVGERHQSCGVTNLVCVERHQRCVSV